MHGRCIQHIQESLTLFIPIGWWRCCIINVPKNMTNWVCERSSRAMQRGGCGWWRSRGFVPDGEKVVKKSVLLICALNGDVIKMGAGCETCHAAAMRLLAARHCVIMCLRLMMQLPVQPNKWIWNSVNEIFRVYCSKMEVSFNSPPSFLTQFNLFYYLCPIGNGFKKTYEDVTR